MYGTNGWYVLNPKAAALASAHAGRPVTMLAFKEHIRTRHHDVAQHPDALSNSRIFGAGPS